MDFKNKRIAIVGLGVEGLSSAEYLASKGAHIIVHDKQEKNELDKDVLTRLAKLQPEEKLGKDYLSGLNEVDMIVRAPGVRLHTKELDEAVAAGVTLTSQTKLFFDLCPCLIIGVTGTKGKGTTSSLIYEMLRLQGIDAYLGGNIGLPPFTFLDSLKKESRVVLELSSFQLEDLHKSPHIAVMLMVTSEHLGADSVGTVNFHDSLEDYIGAKRNILKFQETSDFAILNRDYLPTHESDSYTLGTILLVSRERGVIEDGCFVKDDSLWITFLGHTQKVSDIAKIKLPGKHNLENASAASMAAFVSGVEKDKIKEVLQAFKGLEHRLELVGEVNGVRYYDDSFSTTPETAIAAIEAFPQDPKILILGGSRKGSDFTSLGKVIGESTSIKAIVGIGDEWGRIKTEIRNPKPELLMLEGATDMEKIVKAASLLATPGDVVLLSPACASFGMFKNYKERGSLFKNEVFKLSI